MLKNLKRILYVGLILGLVCCLFTFVPTVKAEENYSKEFKVDGASIRIYKDLEEKESINGLRFRVVFAEEDFLAKTSSDDFSVYALMLPQNALNGRPLTLGLDQDGKVNGKTLIKVVLYQKTNGEEVVNQFALKEENGKKIYEALCYIGDYPNKIEAYRLNVACRAYYVIGDQEPIYSFNTDGEYGATVRSMEYVAYKASKDTGKYTNEILASLQNYITDYTVSFSDGVQSQTVRYGSLVQKPIDPTKQGLVFNGWKNGEEFYDFNTPVTKDLQLVADYSISETRIEIKNSSGVTVTEEGLICSKEILQKLPTETNVLSLFDVEYPADSYVTASYLQEEMVLKATIVSKDGNQVENYQWNIGMENTFFEQKSLAIGSDESITWNFTDDCYTQWYSANAVRAAYYQDGKPLGGLSYTYRTKVQMTQAEAGAEFVLENVETGGSRLRYVLRYDGSRYFVFTDYMSYNTGWKGYRELAQLSSNVAEMGVIRNGDWFIFLLDGVAVWKQEICFGATQIIVGGQQAESNLFDITASTDKETTEEEFKLYQDSYNPPISGNNNYGMAQTNWFAFEETEEGYTFNPADAKIYMNYLYKNGTAIAGQYYTVETTLSIGEQNAKTNPSFGIRILGSNGKALRVYLRINKGYAIDSTLYQMTIDNGSGTESAGTQKRIRSYGNTVKVKVVVNGIYTDVYVDDVLIFTSDGESSKIADDPQANSYTITSKILGVTGHRHIGFIACGAKVTAKDLTATTYSRVLSTYEPTIQKYVDQIKNNQQTVKNVFAGSSFMEFWLTKHNFSETMDGVNVGLAGSHSSDWLQLIDRLITPYSPQNVILYLGGNDASRQGDDMAPYVAQSVIRMIQTIRQKNPSAKVYWLSLISFPSLTEANFNTMKIVNTIVKEYAEKTENVEYVDIASVICPNGVAKEEFYQGSDGVHINSLGYAEVEKLLKQIIK